MQSCDCSAYLHFVPCSAFIKELARVCAPGGKVVLVDFHRCYAGEMAPSHATTMNQMYQLFSTQGEWATPDQHKQLMGEWQGFR